MLKKLSLAFSLSLFAGSAFAACTNPLSIKDGGGAAISMSMTSNADGFCQYNFNMAQVNGAVPLMGNGATGTGSMRMTIANDNTIPTGWPTATNQTAAAAAKGEGATGAAVPSGAQYVGLNSGGNLLGWVAKAGNTYAATDVVPGVAVVNSNPNGQAALASSSPVAIAKNSGTGSTVAGAAVGTAGSASAEVVTVQGIASGTPVPVLATPLTLTNATFVKGTTAAMTGTTSTQIIAAVASNRIYALRVACKGDPANAVATKVLIQDGSGGTTLDTLSVAASGGGEQATNASPLFWTTSGNGLFAQNVTTSSSVICTASGYSG